MTDEIDAELNRNLDFLRSSIGRLQDDSDDKSVPCKCKELGKFVKSEVDYMKPLTVWNKKRIFKDYSVRL